MNPESVQEKNHKNVVAVATALIFVFLVIMFVYYYQNQYRRVDHIKSPLVEKIEHEPIENLDLSAKSAVIWNTQTKEIVYAKNEQDILPLASLTKIMTALVAVETLSPQTNIEIAEDFPEEIRDMRLLIHKNWNLMDLISFTLVTSSNGGAKAIATVAGSFLPDYKPESDPRMSFIDQLNKRADDIGLNATTFYNDSGLDLDEETGGAYGSAADVALLLDYVIRNHPEILEPTKHEAQYMISDSNVLYKLNNTNTSVEEVPGILASKTGTTDLAQANLAVAFSPGLEGPYVAVVLGSSYEERFNDISKLVQAVINRNVVQD